MSVAHETECIAYSLYADGTDLHWLCLSTLVLLVGAWCKLAAQVELEDASVPQYSAALEAAASLGQALRSHYVAAAASGPAALNAVLELTAAMSAAAVVPPEDDEEEEESSSPPAGQARKPKNGAAIPRWVHARIGLARLGVGGDARGVPVQEVASSGETLNVSLMSRTFAGGHLTYTLRVT